MRNKPLIIIVLLGIVVVFIFGIDLFRNRSSSTEQFDFSDITRPQFYKESPTQGSTQARVVLYEYADFGCPHCGSIQSVIAQIRSKYASQILHVWKDFPFLSQVSKDAAIASRCAQQQDAFWEYHDWLFANQKELESLSFSQGAQALGLDEVRFTACLLDDTINTLVERDFAEGRALGVDQTPTLIIGNTALVGVQSFEEVERVIIPLIQHAE